MAGMTMRWADGITKQHRAKRLRWAVLPVLWAGFVCAATLAPSYAAEEPGLEPGLGADAEPSTASAAQATPAIQLYREDPIGNSSDYLRRILAAQAAKLDTPAELEPLQFNLALAWHREGQHISAWRVFQELLPRHHEDFQLYLIALETACRAERPTSELTTLVARLKALSVDRPERQLRWSDTVMAETGALALRSETLKLGFERLHAFIAAGDGAGARAWAEHLDRWLVKIEAPEARAELWEQMATAELPGSVQEIRADHRRFFATQDLNDIRSEAMKYWAQQLADPRADWPAEQAVSSTLDRVRCFQELLSWSESPAEEFARGEKEFPGLVFACTGAERTEAFASFLSWSQTMTVQPAPLGWQAHQLRRQIAEKMLAEKDLAAATMAAAADTLVDYLQALNRQPGIGRRPDARQVGELTVAAVLAYDRSQKSGLPTDCRGLKAVVQAIALTGEDPDLPSERTPRYRFLYDFTRLLKDSETSLPAAELFRDFKASKIPRWRATLWTLNQATKEQAPAATLTALLAGEVWPAEAADELLTGLPQWLQAYPQAVKLSLVAARTEMEFGEWDRAAARLQTLSALKPTGNYAADLETAMALKDAFLLQESLPAEVDAVLVAALQIAPADSDTAVEITRALADLRFAQQDPAGAAKALQLAWDRAQTAAGLVALARLRVELFVAREFDVQAVAKLQADLTTKLPQDAASRWAVLQPLLAAVAESDDPTQVHALIQRELTAAGLHPAMAAVLTLAQADEWQVQGDAQPALEAYLRALHMVGEAQRSIADPRQPTAPDSALLWARMQKLAQRYPSVQTAFEGAAQKALEPAAAEPVMGRLLVEHFNATGRQQAAVLLLRSLSQARPWNLTLRAEAANASLAVGDRINAVREYQSIMVLDPVQPAALSALLKLGVETGDAALLTQSLNGLRNILRDDDIQILQPALTAQGREDLVGELWRQHAHLHGQVAPAGVSWLVQQAMQSEQAEIAAKLLGEFARARARLRFSTQFTEYGDLLTPGGELFAIVNLSVWPVTLREQLLAHVPQALPKVADKVDDPWDGLAQQELIWLQADMLLSLERSTDALALLAPTSEQEFVATAGHFSNREFVVSLCDKLLATEPEFLEAIHRTRALTYEQMGQRDKLFDSYKWLVEHAPKQAQAAWQEKYAELLLSRGRWQEAQSIYTALYAAMPTGKRAATLWRLRRDHPIKGEPNAQEWLDQELAARATPVWYAWRRELRDSLKDYRVDYSGYESLARAVLAVAAPAERSADLDALLEALPARTRRQQSIALLDVEATTGGSIAELRPRLNGYLDWLKNERRLNAENVQSSPFLKALPTEEVFAVLIQFASGDADALAELTAYRRAVPGPLSAAYVQGLLRMGLHDDALQATLGLQVASELPDTWTVRKQATWRQRQAAEWLQATLPEFALPLYQGLASGPAGLDSTRARLKAAECLVVLDRLKEAGTIYGALAGDEAQVADGQGPQRMVVPASLVSVWRLAHFQFLLTHQRDPQAAMKMLKRTRDAAHPAMRQALWNEARAAGRYRDCIQWINEAQTIDRRPLDAALRWDWIGDLLALSSDPEIHGEAFRRQAFTLALDGFVSAEMNGRRQALAEATPDNNADSARDDACRRWFFLLRNMARADSAMRDDLSAMLWKLAATQPTDDTRVTRTLLVLAGDTEGAAGRLAVLTKIATLQPLSEELIEIRLGLLRQLKHTDELLEWHRQATVERPDDREVWWALARELERAIATTPANAAALHTEAVAAGERVLQLCNPSQAHDQLYWAQRMSALSSEQSLRLFRRAAEADPGFDYSRKYAEKLAADGQFETAVKAELDALFVREWRALRGERPMYRDNPILEHFTGLYSGEIASPLAIRAVAAARVTAVSGHHRALLDLALAKLEQERGAKAAALIAARRALAETDTQDLVVARVLGNWYQEWGWQSAAAEVLRDYALTLPTGSARSPILNEAQSLFERENRIADAIQVLERIVAEAPPEADLSSQRVTLAKLYHRQNDPAAAATQFRLAMDLGTPQQRYSAWTGWRSTLLNLAVAADRDRILREFPTWVDQMDSAAGRLTVLRDYVTFLESLKMWPEAAEVQARAADSMNGYERPRALLTRIRYLINANRTEEALAAAAVALNTPEIAIYQIAQELRPIFVEMEPVPAVELLYRAFTVRQLSWSDWQQILNTTISDWRRREDAQAALVSRLLTESPAERELLAVSLPRQLNRGEYDLVFRQVAKALEPASRPAPTLRYWLAQMLGNYQCRHQAAELLEQERVATAVGSWRRAQLDLELARLGLQSGLGQQAAVQWEQLLKASPFQQIRNQAAQQLFDYHLTWRRSGADAQNLYVQALQACPVSATSQNMLAQMMRFYRDRADLPACRGLIEQRMAAGLLSAADRDSLTIDLAQLQMDEAAAARRDPSGVSLDLVFEVFRRRYLKLARQLEENASDPLYARARGILVRSWTRGKTATAWKRAEPHLAALSAVERPGYHRISDLRLEVFRRREEREAVVAELQRRSTQEPTDRALRNQLIQACVEAKQFTAAAALLADDVKASPEDFRPAFALVDLYLAAGQAEGARLAWQQALPKAPKTAAELDELGRRYEERRRYEWALELYRLRQALQPDLGAADNLARLGERMEQPLESVKIYLAYYEGLFKNLPDRSSPSGLSAQDSSNRAHQAIDYMLAERMTPYARNERDFEAALTLVRQAAAATASPAHRAFLTVAMADLQYLRRRQTEALALYREASEMTFPGRYGLLMYLMERLPARKGEDLASAIGRGLLQDVKFDQEFNWSEQSGLLRRFADMTFKAKNQTDWNSTWQRLIAIAPREQKAALHIEYGSLLATQKQTAAAAQQYEHALALDHDVDSSREHFARCIELWENVSDLKAAAQVGDAACQYEQQLERLGEPERWLGANIQRWMRAGAPERGATLLQGMLVADSLTERQRAHVFNEVAGALVSFQPKADLRALFQALQGCVGTRDAWRLELLRARRLGRTDPTGAQKLFESARAAVAAGERTPAEAENAALEVLNAEIEILLFNRRGSQATSLWRDALYARGGKMPGGDSQLIRLYTAAERPELAADFLLEILKSGDKPRIRAISGDLYNIGYSLIGGKSKAQRNRFQPLAEAALIAGEPNVARQAVQIWIDALHRDQRYVEMVDFAARALPAFERSGNDRRAVADQAFSRIYELLTNANLRNVPRPAANAVMDLVVAASLPVLADSQAQPGGYSRNVLEQMKLQDAFVQRLRTEVEQLLAVDPRPIAMHYRAGNLVQQVTTGQTAESIRYWEASLAGNPPNFAELAGRLRDGYRDLNRRDIALQHQTALLNLNPWDIGNRIESAALLTELHRNIEADQAWNEAVKLAAASEDQLQQIADRMHAVERFEPAIDVYKTAYELAVRRGSIDSWRRVALISGLIRCEWKLGHREQAFKFWNEGLARISRRDGAHSNLMDALVDLLAADSNLDGLVAAHEAQRGPSGLDNPNLRDAFGRAYERQSQNRDQRLRRGLEDKALAQLTIAADLLPQDPRIRERMINLLSNRQDWTGMIAQHREISRNDPKNIASYEEMARLYGRLGKLAEREQAWSMILEALPRDGAGHRALANIFTTENLPVRAVAAARAVVENRPEDPASYTLLAEKLRLNQEFAEAEKIYHGVLARAKEWTEKRYWDGEWRNPSNQGLLMTYHDWVRIALAARDEAGAAAIRRRAHAHLFTYQRLKASRSPERDRDYNTAEWNARVAAWEFLRDQLPAEPVPPAAPATPEPNPQPVEVDPNELEGVGLVDEAEMLLEEEMILENGE